jgi:predicted nucleic-acid-binding protein
VSKYRIDTNIILRFLLNDHTTHSPLAKDLVIAATQGKITLIVSPIVVLEAVHVMRYEYDCSKGEIHNALTKFEAMNGIEYEERDVVLDALSFYRDYGKVSFGDAYIASKARHHSPNHVLTFNLKDFTKSTMVGIAVQRLGNTEGDPNVFNVVNL